MRELWWVDVLDDPMGGEPLRTLAYDRLPAYGGRIAIRCVVDNDLDVLDLIWTACRMAVEADERELKALRAMVTVGSDG